MAHEIIIDGVKYVPAEGGEIKIVVLERGFIYVGRFRETEQNIEIIGARSLIRWGTTGHLGSLIEGPSENTKLGDACHVKARVSQLIHTIEVNQDAWNKHID